MFETIVDRTAGDRLRNTGLDDLTWGLKFGRLSWYCNWARAWIYTFTVPGESQVVTGPLMLDQSSPTLSHPVMREPSLIVRP